MADPKTVLNPDKWVDQHGDFLFSYALSRLRNRSAAEDAVQETFLAALKAKTNFGGRSSERTWLVGILKNKIVDHVRLVSREQGSVDVDMLPCEKEQPFIASGQWASFWTPQCTPIDWGSDPESIFENKSFWEWLRHCIESLPPRLAHIFTLREMDQMKTAEICSQTGVTANNLWVMLHRARMQLRRCLELNWIGGK